MIHVVAVITAKAGQREQILEAYRANRPAVLAEKGCIEYTATVGAAVGSMVLRVLSSARCPWGVLSAWIGRSARCR